MTDNIVITIGVYLLGMPMILGVCREIAAESDAERWPIWLYAVVIILWPVIIVGILVVILLGLMFSAL